MTTAAAIVGIVLALQTAAADELDASLARLAGAVPQRMGRDKLVQQYEELVAKHPNDPRSAAAMLRIAGILELTDKAAGMAPQYDKALTWYHRATKTARRGSPEWIDAMLKVVSRVRNRGNVTKAELNESRQLLQQLQDQSGSDFYLASLLQFEWLLQCRQEKNVAQAEVHYRALQEVLKDPKLKTLDPAKRTYIELLAKCAPAQMIEINTLANQRGSAKREAILKLKSENPENRLVQDAAKRSLGSITVELDAPAPEGRSPMARRLLIIGNVVFLLVLAGVAIHRSRRSGR